MSRQACISIDVDSLYCYQGIYDLEQDKEDNSLYEVGLERFVNLMEELDLRGTLFVVGQDIQMAGNARLLKYLSDAGWEIANHSYSHPYRLTQLSGPEMTREVEEGKQTIEQVTGREVVGFRAPGYNLTPQLLQTIAKSGHRYDSSVFPCTPYYLTKAGVLATMAARGKSSHSLLGGPEVLLAPLNPYRPNLHHYWKRGATSLWELPISTSPLFRFPFLGSFLIMGGERWFPSFYKMLSLNSRCLVLELHAMDFMDGRADGLEPALLKQPDVAVSWEEKERLFRRVFETLKATRHVVTQQEAVDILEMEATSGR